MMQALKKKSVIIQTCIYNFIVFAILIISIVLLYGFNIEIEIAIDYLLIALVFIYLLFGFFSSDIYINRYRRKMKLWAGKVPAEIKQRAWELRTPWYLAAIGGVIATIIYYITIS